VEIEIGDWDMDSTNGVSVAHGLPSPDWEKIRGVSAIIIHDYGTLHIDFVSYLKASSPGNVITIGNNSITLNRGIAGNFDNSLFSSTSFNRGFISFHYTPD